MASRINTESILKSDGQDDDIEISQTDLGSILAQGSSTLTIAGWIKPHHLGHKISHHGMRNLFFTHGSDSSHDNLELGISPASHLDIYFDQNQDDITKTLGQGELSIEEWHFFSVIFNKGTKQETPNRGTRDHQSYPNLKYHAAQNY